MKINKITKKKNNTYDVLLSDNSIINIYSDVLIKYNLLKPRTISKQELDSIISYNNYLEAYNIALKYLTSKLRTKKEIEKKLSNFDKEVIIKVIEKLEQDGYLNDSLYIESYLNDQINLTLKGPNKIINELVNLGFNKEQVITYLNNYPDDLWQDRIKKIITKKINSNHNSSNEMLKKKIQVYLINNGYSKYLVEKIINDITWDSDIALLEKAYNKEKNKLSKKYNGEELNYHLKMKLYQKGYNMNDIVSLMHEKTSD